MYLFSTMNKFNYSRKKYGRHKNIFKLIKRDLLNKIMVFNVEVLLSSNKFITNQPLQF